MNFYPHRTVEEQAARLPLDLQENYQATQLDRIKIDGEEIMGYFEYSFMEEKSYTEQPTRSIDGSIPDIDEYTTFLTPRIIIKYNMMNIEDYRKLMKMLKSKNSFLVECYDIVDDKRVTHDMYFAPPSMPIIYQQYLMALGIREYSIELIGTNRKNWIAYDISSSLPLDIRDAFMQAYPNTQWTQRQIFTPGDDSVRIGWLDVYDAQGNRTPLLAAIQDSSPYTLHGWLDSDGNFYFDGATEAATWDKPLLLKADIRL